MKKNKILIVYGTRYGATTGTAEEIAKILQEEDLDVNVVNLKEEKVRDIAEYELIIIGSGIQIYRWTSKAEGFLKQFSRELENMGPFKLELKAAGIKETKPGVYDTRNWDAIQNWAKELAKEM